MKAHACVLLPGFFAAGFFTLIFIGFRIYRCKRRYEKTYGPDTTGRPSTSVPLSSSKLPSVQSIDD
jgi:hypothetical protein